MGYDLRKGDSVLNNFELKKINDGETEEEVTDIIVIMIVEVRGGRICPIFS